MDGCKGNGCPTPLPDGLLLVNMTGTFILRCRSGVTKVGSH